VHAILQYKRSHKPFRKNPKKGREAVASSNIKEIQEVQGGKKRHTDGGAIIPKDA
jgi:hypothetical protein